MKIINLDQIKEILQQLDPLEAIEQGFVQYSQGKACIPPVAELLMPAGEAHIKYGYINGDEFYTVKIASGFYQNSEYGLPSSNGVMLLFSQKTGELVCVLLDEGHLTDIRTAIAGAIAAKWLAPKQVHAIGVVGTGIQARLQPLHLKQITPCRQLMVWGRDQHKLNTYKLDMQRHGFSVTLAQSVEEITDKANLIVTTTPSTQTLLHAKCIKPGTHITAMGSDTPDKQELESQILSRADLVVADSIEQCRQRGEIYQAIKSQKLDADNVVELGHIIEAQSGRQNEEQITVADLTGVAVQDIKIAELVYQGCK